MGYLVGYPWLEARSRKPTQSRGIKSQPSRTPLSLELRKHQNEPLNLRIWVGNQKKKNHEGFTWISPIKSPRTRSRKHIEKTTKRGLRKSLPRTTGNSTTKPWWTTSNHLYIPRRFKQGLACRLIIQPSHKISPWSSQASPMEILRK
jgi:hypothetical protein